MSGFVLDPMLFFEEDEFERATMSLRIYQESYTGAAFDRLIASSNPNRITAQDIVAVSTLSVDVRADVSVWILEVGAEQIASLLAEIPVDATIWDASDLLDGVVQPMSCTGFSRADLTWAELKPPSCSRRSDRA